MMETLESGTELEKGHWAVHIFPNNAPNTIMHSHKDFFKKNKGSCVVSMSTREG